MVRRSIVVQLVLLTCFMLIANLGLVVELVSRLLAVIDLVNYVLPIAISIPLLLASLKLARRLGGSMHICYRLKLKQLGTTELNELRKSLGRAVIVASYYATVDYNVVRGEPILCLKGTRALSSLSILVELLDAIRHVVLAPYEEGLSLCSIRVATVTGVRRVVSRLCDLASAILDFKGYTSNVCSSVVNLATPSLRHRRRLVRKVVEHLKHATRIVLVEPDYESLSQVIRSLNRSVVVVVSTTSTPFTMLPRCQLPGLEEKQITPTQPTS
jgi:hypothetical protein